MGTLLRADRKLTSDGMSAKIDGTYLGMAHFAGTGPSHKTCRECKSWGLEGRHRYRTPPYPVLLDARCSKFTELTKKAGPAVPCDAMACRYFEQSDKVPPRLKTLAE